MTAKAYSTHNRANTVSKFVKMPYLPVYCPQGINIIHYKQIISHGIREAIVSIFKFIYIINTIKRSEETLLNVRKRKYVFVVM